MIYKLIRTKLLFHDGEVIGNKNRTESLLFETDCYEKMFENDKLVSIFIDDKEYDVSNDLNYKLYKLVNNVWEIID